MKINYNMSAMLTNNALANNDNFLAQSLVPAVRFPRAEQSDRSDDR